MQLVVYLHGDFLACHLQISTKQNEKKNHDTKYAQQMNFNTFHTYTVNSS